jgi:hypothetical protein
MRLGTAVITLPLSSNDKGQHKHFLVSKDVPPGYYLLNLITKFPNQNVNLVYTGKAFVPQPTPQVVTKTHTIIECGPGTHKLNGKCVPNLCPDGSKPGANGKCPPPIECPADYKQVKNHCETIYCINHTSDPYCNGQKGRDGEPFCDINDKVTCYDRFDNSEDYCKQFANDPFCKPANCTKDPKAVGCPAPQPQTTACSDGSIPDANGKCVTQPTIDCTADPSAAGCSTSGQPTSTPPTTTTCPAGSTPDASGNCSLSQPTQQLLPTPPSPSNGCPDGSKTDCSSQTPTTPNTGSNENANNNGNGEGGSSDSGAGGGSGNSDSSGSDNSGGGQGSKPKNHDGGSGNSGSSKNKNG